MSFLDRPSREAAQPPARSWVRRDFVRTLTAAGIGCAVCTTARSNVLSGRARGHVICDKRPVPNVAVSDGFAVTQTDQSGRFELALSPQSGPHLFVSVPRGYWCDRFFVSTNDAGVRSTEFRLERSRSDADYDALFVTDIHLGEGRRELSYERFAATIDEINKLKPAPAFVWIGGDITLQGNKGAAYADLIARLKMPVRHIPGNHELHISKPNPLEEFHARFGPSYYSFDVGAVHYVALDGCMAVPAEKGYRTVHGYFSARELHWLAEDLRRVPEGKSIVVAVHIPLISTYAARREVNAVDVPWWIMSNADEAIEIFAKHHTRFVLQGHLHENERVSARSIEFVETVSVCGRWWRAEGREEGVSGEPRGYRRLQARGENIVHDYLSSAESRVAVCGEIVGRPAKLERVRAAELFVNIFDAPPAAVVTARIDEKDEPVRLEPVTPIGKHEGARMAHHWRWQLDSAALAAGAHRFTFRCKSSEGYDESFAHDLEVV